jgi:penicillin-binding protein 1A
MEENSKPKEKKTNFKKLIRWFWILILSPFASLFLLIWLTSLGMFGELPDTEQLENPINNLATEVFSSDGKILGKFYAENRTNVKFKQLSPYLVNALVATEDARFFEHSGVDLRGLFRVLFVTVLGGDQSGGGGSTITQQLAKMLFHGERPKGKLSRAMQKIKEWIIATRLERQYTKEEIIAMYLNKFDFLNLAVGIESASKIYFDKMPDSLNLQESAMLVGMAKNPSLFNPIRRGDTTMHRRNVVMMQMVKYGYLKKEEYNLVKTKPLELNFKPESHNEGLATYFREHLRDVFLKKWIAENPKPDGKLYDVYRDGLKIYTTIDSRMQRYAEEAVKQQMTQLQERFVKAESKRKNYPFVGQFQGKKDEEIVRIMRKGMKNSERYKNLIKRGISETEIEKNFDKPDTMRVFSWRGEIDTVMTPNDSIRYYKTFLQCGFMSMEPQSGFVKAWVGGINHKHFQYDHVQIGHDRQVGSTFKPFVYALAIQEGWSPCMRVPNVPVTIHFDDKEWTPRNSSSKKLDGKMLTLKYALAQSVNYVTAYVMKNFGPQAVVTVTKQLGITSQLDPYPSICLGTPDISVYEMVGAYSAFANKGTYNQPVFVTRIEDKNGKVLYEFIPKKVEVMDEEKAYIMCELMKGCTQYGTGTALRGKEFGLTTAIAGKTGTTQHNADGWFMGVTPDLVSGCWVGGDDPIIHFLNMEEGQGSRMALPVFGYYMKKIYADKTIKISKGDFEKPSKKIDIELDCTKYEKEIENEEEGFDSDNPNDFDKPY